MNEPTDVELDPHAWLRRAASNLARARVSHGVPDVLLEDLCFDLQQAVEKALKGLLIARTGGFPKIHSISQLASLLDQAGITLPARFDPAMEFTLYAVRMRYPGPPTVSEEEFTAARDLAEALVAWARDELARSS